MKKLPQKEKLTHLQVELEVTTAKVKGVKEGEDRDKVAEEDQVEGPEEALHLDQAHPDPNLDQEVVLLEELAGIRVLQAQEDLPHQPEELRLAEEVHPEAQEEAHLEALEARLEELVGIRVHPAQEDLHHQPEELHQTEEVHQEAQEEAHLEALEVDLKGVQEEAHLEVQEDHLTQEAVEVLQFLNQATLLQQDLVQVDLKVDP